MAKPAVVGILMGSDSDLEAMAPATEALAEFGVPFEVRVLSAHRTPDDTLEYARSARERGLRVIIAGAGGAAHLPGVIAAATTLPVIGVPIASTPLSGFDALLAIVQMPPGIPVATVAVGGARNAAILAVRILATGDGRLRKKVESFQASLAEASRAKDLIVRERFPS